MRKIAAATATAALALTPGFALASPGKHTPCGKNKPHHTNCGKHTANGHKK